MTKFALKNPMSVIVLAIILFITGVMSFIGMRREANPEIKIPYIFVTTLYPGANPPEIEKLVTQKIEDELEGIDGVKKITSTSNESYSNIFLEFDPSVDIEDALRRVKNKVDQAKDELPDDAEEPVIQELNFSSIPIVKLSLFADYDIEQLESIADNLQDRMEKIQGVLESKVLGKQEKEIAVDADPALLKQYDLTLQDIVNAIQGQHRNIPGGTMKTSGFRFSIKVTGELSGPDEFNDLIVRADDQGMIRIKDVAKVEFTYTRDRQSISRTNGKPSLTLTVAKRTGEDIIRISNEVLKIVEQEKTKWPAGTHYEITYDESKYIIDMINELQNHLLMGIILVMLVLSFFLGARNSVFISTAIPFSMAIGFIVLSYSGITLNMVVLFSLVLVLGMLVDDGIVVVENIFRHLQMGKNRWQASLDGTKEVAIPVFTATLTTVGAFTPILFMPGIMGEFMKYLPMTVGITLLGSLFVAFVFNPVFSSLTMNVADMHKMEGGKKGFFERFKDFYKIILDKVLNHPWLLLAFCLLFIVSGIFLYGKYGPGVVFFPNSDPAVVAVEVEGPLSQDISMTDSTLKIQEAVLLNVPDSIISIKSINAIAGSGKSGSFSGGQAETHKGYVDVVFKDFIDRDVRSTKSMEWMEKNLKQLSPGWKVRVIKQEDGPPVGKPIEYEICGEDYAQLSWIADSLKKLFATIPGITNVDHDYDPARPEIRIDVDREQAMRLGFSTIDVASSVRSSIFGTEAAEYRVGKEEYKIMVRLAPEIRENINGFNQITVSKDGKDAYLPSMALISQGANIASISHVDTKRTIQIWGELAPGQKDEQKPKKNAQQLVDKVSLPVGYTVSPGSSNKDQEETQSFIIKAFFIALSIVFLIMVFQFNSLFQPFLILIGIMISVGGVFWGLLIVNGISEFGNIITKGAAEMNNVTFSILFSGIGITALAGVVAKNGIVLIDFMNKLRKDGRNLRDAVIEGGATRLRPVLLTAITAMIGVLPLATGVGVDFVHLKIVTKSESTMWWSAMAWPLFWGLLFNTILVLIVTPTLYYAWEKWRAKGKAKKDEKSAVKQGLKPVNL